MNKDTLIRLSGVSKRFQMGSGVVQALREVDLVIKRGDFLAVMGPSGSGKSTLMNIIGLLDRPDEGSYLLEDQDVGGLDDDRRSYIRNRTIGFIFQNFNLLSRATAYRNVMLPLAYRPMPETERHRLALQALDAVGLSPRAEHTPPQLSGGERQRVAIARALVGGPSVILADEPTGNLDSRAGDEIIELLTEISGRGKTVILVTHDHGLTRYAVRVIRMIDGAIIEE